MKPIALIFIIITTFHNFNFSSEQSISLLDSTFFLVTAATITTVFAMNYIYVKPLQNQNKELIKMILHPVISTSDNTNSLSESISFTTLRTETNNILLDHLNESERKKNSLRNKVTIKHDSDSDQDGDILLKIIKDPKTGEFITVTKIPNRSEEAISPDSFTSTQGQRSASDTDDNNSPMVSSHQPTNNNLLETQIPNPWKV
jgi:hypothetical protein